MIHTWILLQVDNRRFHRILLRRCRRRRQKFNFRQHKPSPFSNPDETIEAVTQPVPDDSSSEEPHITEPERE